MLARLTCTISDTHRYGFKYSHGEKRSREDMRDGDKEWKEPRARMKKIMMRESESERE